MNKKLADQFSASRDRSRDAPIDMQDEDQVDWLSLAVGRRYCDCTIGGFQISPGEHAEAMKTAVHQCRSYVTGFRECIRDGRSLMFIGPKGTGKDHLMVAVLRAIVDGYGVLTKDQASDTITLNQELLLKQFGLETQ